jgi:hypothetical protein
VSSFDYRLNKMVEILDRCLRRAAVFSRGVPNRSLIDWIVREEKGGPPWAVVAAGIPDDTARRYFKPDSERGEHAMIPLGVSGGGQATILLQMRPVAWPSSQSRPTGFLAHYASAEDLPFVEILKGQINLDLPKNDLGLFNLRWEVDPGQSGRPPLEDWLHDWWRTLGHNPAHPSSHLHFNSQPKASAVERSRGSEETGETDLRLAIGDCNPLAFLLSVAAWVRRNLDVQ